MAERTFTSFAFNHFAPSLIKVQGEETERQKDRRTLTNSYELNESSAEGWMKKTAIVSGGCKARISMCGS